MRKIIGNVINLCVVCRFGLIWSESDFKHNSFILYRPTQSTFTLDQQLSFHGKVCHKENINLNIIPKSDKAGTVL